MFAIRRWANTGRAQWGQWVIDTVRNFTFSADQQIGPQHWRRCRPTYLRRGRAGLGEPPGAEMSNQRGTVPIEHDTCT